MSPAFHDDIPTLKSSGIDSGSVRLDPFALAQAPDVVVVFSIVVQGGAMDLFLHRFSGAAKASQLSRSANK